jgi:hypothetical protein
LMQNPQQRQHSQQQHRHQPELRQRVHELIGLH